ncbi:hypothetical protein OIDMADRAFT_19960, partial [Oidiodendron maius Zn]
MNPFPPNLQAPPRSLHYWFCCGGAYSQVCIFIFYPLDMPPVIGRLCVHGPNNNWRSAIASILSRQCDILSSSVKGQSSL